VVRHRHPVRPLRFARPRRGGVLIRAPDGQVYAGPCTARDPADAMRIQPCSRPTLTRQMRSSSGSASSTSSRANTTRASSASSASSRSRPTRSRRATSGSRSDTSTSSRRMYVTSPGPSAGHVGRVLIASHLHSSAVQRKRTSACWTRTPITRRFCSSLAGSITRTDRRSKTRKRPSTASPRAWKPVSAV
jgi:hypothetical protein